MSIPWPVWLPWPPGPFLLWWHRTWYAPCNDITTPGKEFVWLQVRQGTSDRLQSVPVQPAKLGNAMRVEVRNGDFAWNPYANNGQGAQIGGGWRAEAVGPTEHETATAVIYNWSTMLTPTYVNDPRIDDATDPNNGKPTWQVIFQWHQGDSDQGGAPPIAFIIIGNNILLDLHRPDPANESNSLHVGQWPVATLDRGTWHDFAASIRWHTTDGSIKVWHNGQPVIFNPQVPAEFPNQAPYPAQATDTLTGLGTLFPPKANSTSAASAYMKVGLYRKAVNTNPVGPFVLYHDEVERYERGFIIFGSSIPWPFNVLDKLIPKINLRPPQPPPPPFSDDLAAATGETPGGQPSSG